MPHSWFRSIGGSYTKHLVPKEPFPGLTVPSSIEKESRFHNRLTGYELECQIDPLMNLDEQARQIWSQLAVRWNLSVGTDSSINYVSGKEAVELRLAPAWRASWGQQVHEVVGFLNDYAGLRVDTSTGGHTHVEMQDGGPNLLLRFLALYCAIEPALFFFHPARVSNTYCRPARPYVWGAVEQVCRNESLQARLEQDRGLATKLFYYAISRQSRLSGSRAQRRAEMYRYLTYIERHCAINLTSLYKYRTVEFRLASGTTDKEFIYRWGRLCSAIPTYAKRLRWGSLKSFFKSETVNMSDSLECLFKCIPYAADREYWQSKLSSYQGTEEEVLSRYNYKLREYIGHNTLAPYPEQIAS